MKNASPKLSRCWLIRTLPLVGLAGILCSESKGGEAEMKKFQEVQAKYQERLLAARSSYEALDKRLGELERKYAAERNYEAAERVSKERQALGRAMALPVAPSKKSGAGLVDADLIVTLPLTSAALAGGLVYDATSEVVKGWVSAGAMATWELPAPLLSGAYAVEVTYSLVGTEAVVSLSESHFSSTQKVPPTESWEDFQTLVLGSIRLQPGSRKFQICLNGGNAEGWHLKSVRLRPPLTQ